MMSKTVPIHDNVFDVLFDVIFYVIFNVILYHVFDDFFRVVSEDWFTILCRCWNDNSGMHLAANFGPNSGRQCFLSAQQRADAEPNSGFLTSDGNGDTHPISIADCLLPRLG